jgi:hypothetical protein
MPDTCHGASIYVQVASRTHVVLFDLLALCQQQQEALEACLGPLMGSSTVLKLGFEVSGDINKLVGSWPCMRCFRQMAGVLDLRPVWVAYGLATRHQVRDGRRPCRWLCSSVGWLCLFADRVPQRDCSGSRSVFFR